MNALNADVKPLSILLRDEKSAPVRYLTLRSVAGPVVPASVVEAVVRFVRGEVLEIVVR